LDRLDPPAANERINARYIAPPHQQQRAAGGGRLRQRIERFRSEPPA
jgi:hypothetical protein